MQCWQLGLKGDHLNRFAAGGIEYRHVYLDMSAQEVEASNWTRAGRTCPAAMGFSFAAGTTDGTPLALTYHAVIILSFIIILLQI